MTQVAPRAKAGIVNQSDYGYRGVLIEAIAQNVREESFVTRAAKEPQPPPSVADVLELISSAAAGPILLTLGKRPLRTGQLTEEIPTFAPRTVYRRTAELTDLGLLERLETQGVPSTVLHRLAPGRGRDLLRTLDAYASVELPRDFQGKIDEAGWTTIRLLGEMWGWGWFEELAGGRRCSTELSEATPGLSFHQAKRRCRLLRSHHLLELATDRCRGTPYQLAPRARRGMALVVGVARWRQRHLLGGKQPAMNISEMGTILRACIPLIKLPGHPEAAIKFGGIGPDGVGGPRSEAVVGMMGSDGRMRCSDPDAPAEAWVLGTVDAWISAMLGGRRGRIRTGGDHQLAQAGLTALHDALWHADASPAK